MNLALVYADFISQFPEFASISETVVQMNFDMASDYISSVNYGSLRDGARLLALYQLTAHLLRLSGQISKDQMNGSIISATEGSVSLTVMQPENTNEFTFWINQTPYGHALSALLKVKSAFGLWAGGSRINQNTRKYNGRFGC